MTIDEITDRICAFRDARDWMQFHNPKDLAVAIAAEAGELMQPFVWKSAAQSEVIVSEKREAIASEVADVAILLFEFARNAGIIFLLMDARSAIRRFQSRSMPTGPLIWNGSRPATVAPPIYI